jgi:hypothetical protein
MEPKGAQANIIKPFYWGALDDIYGLSHKRLPTQVTLLYIYIYIAGRKRKKIKREKRRKIKLVIKHKSSS